MSKTKLKIIMLSSIVAFSGFGLVAGTLSWFATTVNVSSMEYVTGGSDKAYFAYGNGTPEKPYGINRPRHLYNLAWLQYNGNFNSSQDGAIKKQYYFEIDPRLPDDEPIDMTGIVLPPIGTEDNPFVGQFNGNGKTISNLTISNSADLDSPTQVTYNDQPEIVGFFGVVGSIKGEALPYSYNSSVVSVSDFTLNNFTVESSSTNTLIGLAAGYLNATGGFSDVQVTGASSIEVDGCKPITAITDNISDYSLIGYCETTNTVSDFTKDISEILHKESGSGMVGGFGASVNFKDYTEWFYSLHQNKEYDLTSKTADIGYMNHMNASSSEKYNSKSGTNFNLRQRVVNADQLSDPDYSFGVSYANIPSNGNYLNLQFNFKKDGTGIYKEFSPSSYYSQTFTWSDNGQTGTNLRYLVDFSSNVSRYSTNKIDVKCQSVSGGVPTSMRIYSRGGNSTIITLNFTYTNNHVYHLEPGCYIPLKFGDDTKADVSSANTGYITGASLISDTNYYGNATPRLSSYSSDYLSNSLSNGNVATVKTYNFSSSSWVTLTETTDGETGEVTGVTNVDFSSGKYPAARNKVAEIVNGQDTVHGIHFDVHATNTYASGLARGSVDANECITANMLLKSYSGVAKSTKMPRGCIDFELEDTGYITFFAGLYNMSSDVTNLNFFSIHHVNRSTPTSFTLKEIKKVYKSNTWTEDNPSYVYQYADDTYSGTTDGGNPLFDMTTSLWPNRSKDNTLYYFEIPVNEGEFVMGSVDKSHTNNTSYQGAYLIYLDIGSNGKSAGKNTMDAFYTETTNNSASYPQGVDFGITGLTSIGGNTICLTIVYTDLTNMTATVSGAVEFAVNSIVSVDSTIEDTELSYKYDSGVVDISQSTETISDLSGSSGSTIVSRILRADITDSGGVDWVIEYDDLTSSYTKIMEGSTDKTSQGASIVPEIFKTNIAAIKAVSCYVELEYTGTDFDVTSVTYNNTAVAITIPEEELGDTELEITLSGSYTSITVNGSPHAATVPTP